jgi:DNA polymerase-1
MALIALDTETSGLNLLAGKELFSFSEANEDGESQVFRLDTSEVARLQNLQRLSKNFKTHTPIMHNAGFDLRASERILNEDLAFKVSFHDTSIQSHILRNNHPSHRLKDLAYELAGFPKDDERKIKQFLKGKDPDYSKVPESIMTPYQHNDAQRTMLLHLFFYPKILANKKWLSEYEMELALVPVNMRIEEAGVCIDPKEIQLIIMENQTKMDLALDNLESFTGERINPDKTEHVKRLLFDYLKYPILKEHITPTGAPSTDKETIADLKLINTHPILEELLKYRAYAHGKRILKSYLRLADNDNKIHPSIHTNGAATSRESSSNPNLQNIEKEGVLLNPYPTPARRCFVPEPEHVLFFIDYAGIEMRLLVFYSREPSLLKICRSGGDMHEPASIVFYGDRFKNADKLLKKSLRGAAKNMNFAIPYDAGWLVVAVGLGLSKEEGYKVYQLYRREFPKLSGLNRIITKEVRERGYIDTTFGRRLYIPEEEAFTGTNYLIQGTAAGIMKRAQPRVYDYLRGSDVKIIMPIHDELVLQWPRRLLAEARPMLNEIRERMIDFPEFDLPLEVEVQYSTINWAMKKEFKLAA